MIKMLKELKYIVVDRVKEKVDNVVILFALKTKDKVIFVSGVSKISLINLQCWIYS